MDLLVSEGVGEVKVLSISERLGVSRSSFYWYFKSRQDLLDALLKRWEQTNTGQLVRHAEMPAATITEAVCNTARCWVDTALFNHKLDFAIREWARRDGAVRRVIDQTDATRVDAFTAMFERFGYGSDEAEVRARVMYFMQVGYYALELSEPLAERMKRVRNYVLSFTGQEAKDAEVNALIAYAIQAQGRD
ncbi:TetR/AcrR family transcriptional regulator [Sulfitobacter sp. TSTF-M16]|uniref:TetR/AcrR family transcriptional regulator n=2 Tax=Sulfitobacter aestuariivivens TaxID=2766981 RepID=A0A927HGD4_9RHOB|nr:TetR/AcrR family transcriptional regulator [Sulfitobacter aestuariivivens]MBD3664120.1 TetR/AcrR family transcriptional regulator [Sulfitobacter aestuariivivens]